MALDSLATLLLRKLAPWGPSENDQACVSKITVIHAGFGSSLVRDPWLVWSLTTLPDMRLGGHAQGGGGISFGCDDIFSRLLNDLIYPAIWRLLMIYFEACLCTKLRLRFALQGPWRIAILLWVHELNCLCASNIFGWEMACILPLVNCDTDRKINAFASWFRNDSYFIWKPF